MRFYFTIQDPSNLLDLDDMLMGKVVNMPAGQADTMSGFKSAGFRREGTV